MAFQIARSLKSLKSALTKKAVKPAPAKAAPTQAPATSAAVAAPARPGQTGPLRAAPTTYLDPSFSNAADKLAAAAGVPGPGQPQQKPQEKPRPVAIDYKKANQTIFSAYERFLGRRPLPAEFQLWIDGLKAGKTFDEVTAAIAALPKAVELRRYRENVVVQYFRDELKRNPRPEEMASAIAAFESGLADRTSRFRSRAARRPS